jgi:hypothetical protein
VLDVAYSWVLTQVGGGVSVPGWVGTTGWGAYLGPPSSFSRGCRRSGLPSLLVMGVQTPLCHFGGACGTGGLIDTGDVAVATGARRHQ